MILKFSSMLLFCAYVTYAYHLLCTNSNSNCNKKNSIMKRQHWSSYLSPGGKRFEDVDVRLQSKKKVNAINAPVDELRSKQPDHMAENKSLKNCILKLLRQYHFPIA